MKKTWLTLAAALLAGSCAQWPPDEAQQRFSEAILALSRARTEMDRFYALDYAEKEAFNTGRKEAAWSFAEEHARLLPLYKGNWNYGNAVQDVNIVFGRIALSEGRVEDAKKFLLKAGDTPGSPQLKSFGPNMTLARELLEKGERRAVVEYFGKCSRFWKMHQGKLDEWTRQAEAGEIPDFGANLIY